MKKTTKTLFVIMILMLGAVSGNLFAQTVFSSEAVWGDKASYTEHEAANWAVWTIDGNEVYAITTSNISPIHKSGNAWFDPDGDETVYGGGSGSALGEYAYVSGSNMDDFKITLKAARPGFDADNGNWDFGIIWGLSDDLNYNYVNFGTSAAAATSAAFVDGEGLRGGPDGLNFAIDMNVVKFQDTLLHEVTLEKVGNMVIVKYEGATVLSIEDDAIDVQGDIGFGSWNDGAYFDDIVVEALAAFTGSTDVSVSTTIGTLTGKVISDIPDATTAQDLLNALTLANGTTAKVVGPNADNIKLVVEGTEELTSEMSLLVTSESGFMVEYELVARLSDDVSILAYYAPLKYDEETEIISTIDGTTQKIFLSSIKPQDGATEALYDGDTEVTDTAALITTGMVYRVTAENMVATKDYAIETFDPPYPTFLATKVSDANPIEIDEYFDDWAEYGNSIEIADIDEESDLIAPDDAADLSGSMKFAWDEDFLYAYFRVVDQTTVTTAENSWENDGIEFDLIMTDDIGKRASFNLFWQANLQPGNEKLLYVPGATMAQTITNGNNTEAERRDFTGAVLASWELEDGDVGYELEMALPWTGLNGIDNPEPFVPELGNKFTSNVGLNDNDGSGRESILFIVADGLNSDASLFPLIELSSPLSISKTVSALVPDLYPNPARDFLHCSNIEKARMLEITNLSGQLVKRMELTNNGEFSINVSDLSTGIYLISITDLNGSDYRGKFIKR